VNSSIHSTAVIGKNADIHPKAVIGPYCIVDGQVQIGSGTELISHVVVTGHTRLGSGNRIFPFASIGHEPQDLKYAGEPSEIIIGNNNTIRENVTINPGTQGGNMLTCVGDNNLLMAYAHVAHDCRLGNSVILANCATLAGHVEIADHAIVGGLSAIHQFIRIGCYAMIGGMSGIVKDVPPYCLTAGGYRPGLAGLNLVGLKRHGFSKKSLACLKKVYITLLQGSGKLEARLHEAEQLAEGEQHALHLLDFVRTAKRGLTGHRRNAG